MPNFPEIDPEITCDRALNMILASIAMEELALSNIVSAESEKLHYVLGVLESNSERGFGVDEVIKVNQSVNGILDSVLQNQMILKNKMEKTLCALSEVCPRHPCPPIPPCPPCPPCPPIPPCPTPKPPQPLPCTCTSRVSGTFKEAEKCKRWRSGTALPWSASHRCNGCFRYDPCDKTKIEVHRQGRFLINFSANVRGKGGGCNAVTISLQTINNHLRSDVFTLHTQLPTTNEIVTISMNGIVVESFENPCVLLFMLRSPDSLLVEESRLSIIGI